jgi:hypothetical protein
MSKRLITLNITNRSKKIKINDLKFKKYTRKDIWNLRLSKKEHPIIALMMNPPWREAKSLKKFVCFLIHFLISV